MNTNAAGRHPLPDWIVYDRIADTLTIHGKCYAAEMFGEAGFLGPRGTILRVESEPTDDVVTIKAPTLDELTGTIANNFPMLAIIRALDRHAPGIRTAFAPPKAAGSASGAAGDSARLEYVLSNAAWVRQKKADSGAMTYWLETQDEDENYIRLSGEHFHGSPRDAIDAALRADGGDA